MNGETIAAVIGGLFIIVPQLLFMAYYLGFERSARIATRDKIDRIETLLIDHLLKGD